MKYVARPDGCASLAAAGAYEHRARACDDAVMEPRAFASGDVTGEMNLVRVKRAWQVIRSNLIPKLDGTDERYAKDKSYLCARRFDEAQPGGERTYIQAASLIRVALDNLDALDHLLTSKGATLWAPWNLLRGVFEPAAWANWLLDPDDGAERRRRGIRRAVIDQKEWRNFVSEFVLRSSAGYQERVDRDTKISAVYRAEAQACGLTWSRAGQKINLVDELPRLRSVIGTFDDDSQGRPSMVVGLWRSLSGMAHGYPYAAHNNSEILASIDIPGGQRVTYSIKDTSFEVHAMASTSLLVAAIGLYLRRCDRTD
jgi:hypothetical protein